MKKTAIFLLTTFLLLPGILNAVDLPDSLAVSLESGFSFSTYSILNQGIQNSAANLESIFGPDGAGRSFKDLNFEIPILIKASLAPFGGKFGRKLSLFFRTGYLPTFSWNTINLIDTTLEHRYTVGVMPIEIGAEFKLMSFTFLGKRFSLYSGLGFGLYSGTFSIGFTDSNNTSGVDQSTYPRSYGGRGMGFLLSLNGIWKISNTFSIISGISYRYANISSLKAHVTRSDGSVEDEQLFTNSTGFVSSMEQQTGTTPAEINLSGLSISFGVRFSFGEARLTDIPEGLYR